MNAGLISVERKAAAEYLYWDDVGSEIEARLKDPSSTQVMKQQMGRIQAFPNGLAKLTMAFNKLISPLEVKFDILWGLIYLNLKVSTYSFESKHAANLPDVIFITGQTQTHM
jgi:hypothetical protein